jgi:hypothetical protein
LAEANGYVQDLNDTFTNPSGIDRSTQTQDAQKATAEKMTV